MPPPLPHSTFISSLTPSSFLSSPSSCAGTLSAWYVWGALGLYPLTGTTQYFVGSPAVDRATITLPKGVQCCPLVYVLYIRTYVRIDFIYNLCGLSNDVVKIHGTV